MRSTKAFISYSHNDTDMLELLHKHLKQLQRDSLIDTWEDREIQAGGQLDQQISKALNNAGLFLALLSPDYIASNYCYEKEFEKALQMQEENRLIIIPIILEPCDWLNTPFSKFKAIPKDGKAISTWENKNTAFLDVAQNIRRLVEGGETVSKKLRVGSSSVSSRNYRIKKDFDSIEKLEFLENTFREVKEMLHRYIAEILQLENIKVRVLLENDKNLRALLVNRNKINTESELLVTTDVEAIRMRSFFRSDDQQINYSINAGTNQVQKSYTLGHDDFQLFWMANNIMYGTQPAKEKFDAKEIAETIWNEWLSSVGIL
jgi:hypothetical protein